MLCFLLWLHLIFQIKVGLNVSIKLDLNLVNETKIWERDHVEWMVSKGFYTN